MPRKRDITSPEALLQYLRRKRATSPEALLQRVMRDLQRTNTPNHPSHGAAVRALVAEGPLLCEATPPLKPRDPDVSRWRAELLEFLRRAVLVAQGTNLFGTGFVLDPVMLNVTTTGDRLRGYVKGTTRDVAILQLFLLMLQVGLRNIRQCGAGGPWFCPRLFVKTYRREFCSVRCQQRDYKRRQRRQQREEEEQQQLRARWRIANTTRPLTARRKGQ